MSVIKLFASECNVPEESAIEWLSCKHVCDAWFCKDKDKLVAAAGRGDMSFEGVYNPPRKRKREVDDERNVRAKVC